MQVYPWIVHLVRGTGRKGMIDAHTHGLDVMGVPEFQFVLDFPTEIVLMVLNDLATMVQRGVRFKDGDEVENLPVLTCKVLLREAKDAYGEDVLRVVIPDGQFRYPENSDEWPYNQQYESPYADEPDAD